MNPRSEPRTTSHRSWERGQRLSCRTCGAEVEIIQPCTCPEPHFVLRCCGEELRPSTSVAVNISETG